MSTLPKPPSDGWKPVDSLVPKHNALYWIRGLQLSPIRVRYQMAQQYKPCWFPIDVMLKGVGQYFEACEEWQEIES